MNSRQKRLKLTLSFDGSIFSGWQTQSNGPSIQETVEKALHKIIGSKILLMGSSRTDAGVHALEGVAHFDTDTSIPLEGLLAGTNSHLPPEIVLIKLEEVAPNFHARKDAKLKTYHYLIYNRKIRNPFWEDRTWQITDPLNCKAMAEAAHLLRGEHDFSCFQAADPKPRNPLRTLKKCQVHEEKMPDGGTKIQIEVTSQGFLKYMVRNIVGTLVEVGKEKRLPQSLKELLQSKDRTLAGPTAPPDGLYLVKIEY